MGREPERRPTSGCGPRVAGRSRRPAPQRALRSASAFGLERGVVDDSLTDSPADVLFQRAWRSGLDVLEPEQRRGALLGAMGHIAESVVESNLADLGYAPVWHFEGPGRHGVDLIMLSPAGQVAAVEVKSTFRPAVIPRLTVRELTQMSSAWLDKADNPGMTEWGLEAADVYGVVAAVNFADRTVRYAATVDFVRLHPLTALGELNDLELTSTSWATSESEPG